MRLKLKRTQSHDIYEEMCRYIPGGVNSPLRAFREVGSTPLIVSHAKADTIFDVDGYKYIDFCNSWGALILGHADEDIVKAAFDQIQKGSTYGISTEVEGLLAKEIISVMPHIEKLRFVSTGTEATMSAIRLARGYTGKDFVIKFSGNYHGHVDALLVKAGSALFNQQMVSSSNGVPLGVVQNTISLPYNDIESLNYFFESSKHKEDVACIILEPIAGNMGVIQGDRSFIKRLREICTNKNIVLIFDEVMSGFRVSLKGAVDYFDVLPDLTCLGKIIGGGFPAAAFGGRQCIMNKLSPLGDVYQAGTLSGNPVAMRAGFEVLKKIKNPNFYEELDRKCRLLLDPVEKKLSEKKDFGCVQRVGGMFTIFFGINKVTSANDAKNFNSSLFKNYFKFLLEKGIYMPQSQYEAAFISAAHTDENLKYTSSIIVEWLDYVFKGL
jgi:glutamate-1-semialdehyde 2,1-aminomutase